MTREWKEVKRRNKGSMFDRLGREHGKHKDLRFEELCNVSVTVYVSNFPTTVGSLDLWKLCDRHRSVADVYIAQKLSKSGHHFAFVQFVKIPDSKLLLEDLNKIGIISYHLFASMARFDRKQFSQRPHDTQFRIPTKVGYGMKHTEHAKGNRSYATAVTGNNDILKAQSDKLLMKKIVWNQSDLLVVPDTSCVVLAKIQHVSKTFKVDERIVWVELDGLPLSAWTSNAFKKVASWVPDFDAIDDHSQKEWASNNSDSDEDEQSIHINNEGEEGEIKENNKDEENIDIQVDEVTYLKKYIDSIGVHGSNIGSLFNHRSASDFNEFIKDFIFSYVPFGGHAFTRISGNGEKLSRLDRFLLSEDVTNIVPNLMAFSLDMLISDHRPIILMQSNVDFDPTPFKFYNSWLSIPDFDGMVTKVSNQSHGPNAMLMFKDKVKHLKSNIKVWTRKLNASKSEEKGQLSSKIAKIERDLEAGLGSSTLHPRQADENTKFFHGIIKKKRRSLESMSKPEMDLVSLIRRLSKIFLEFFVKKIQSTWSRIEGAINTMHDIVNVHPIEGHDAWHWSLLISNIFTVKDTRIYIDSISFPDFPIETRWCRFIPRKGAELRRSLSRTEGLSIVEKPEEEARLIISGLMLLVGQDQDVG
ncbi:RNA-directed DNA polymerase, eukaryota, reverse transcriptase zinc-binding domain protein [Tanacetum coccineum]